MTTDRERPVERGIPEERRRALPARAILLLALLVGCLLIAFPEVSPAAESSTSPRILVLVTQDVYMGSNMQLIAGLREVFPEVEEAGGLFVEYLDETRFPGMVYERLLVEFLAGKYPPGSIDLVIAVARPAVRFLEGQGDLLLPETPRLWVGIEEGALELDVMRADTHAVLFAPPWQQNLELILRVLPDTRRIVVIDNGPATAYEEVDDAAARAIQDVVGRGVQVDFLSGVPYDELGERLSTLPDRSAVLFYGLVSDHHSSPHRSPGPVLTLTESSNAPMFASSQTLLGRGFVGGAVVDFREHGRTGGVLARRILAGATPSELGQPPVSRPVYRFDDRALRRWDIRRRSLPEDSIILFRVPSLWEAYRGWIVLTLTLFAGQTALFLALLGRGRRLRAASEHSQQLQHELEHAGRVGTMGELAGSLSHELNQPLAAIMSNARAALRFVEGPQPDLDEVRDALGEIVEDDRRAGELIRRLRAFLKRKELEMQPLDLGEVVRDVLQLVRSESNLRGVRIAARLDPGLPEVMGDRVQLQQVVFNLIKNAIDEAAVAVDRRVSMRTERTPQGDVVLTVRDRGRGVGDVDRERIFEPFVSTKEDGMGLGLSISRTIVASHLGTIEVENHRQGGAVARLVLPARSGATASATDSRVASASTWPDRPAPAIGG